MNKYFNKYMILLLLVTIVWGSTFVIIKSVINELNEYFLVFARTFLAAIVMFIYLLVKNRKVLADRYSIARGLLLGFLLGAIYSSQVIGLNYTTTGHSAFITGVAVILVPVFLFLFWKQKFQRYEIVGVLIVFAGVFFLTFTPGAEINIGDAITLITAVTAAFHFILAGKFIKKADILSLITYQFVGSAGITFFAFLLSGDSWPELSSSSLYAIFYLGLLGTLFCYFVYVWVQKYVKPMLVVLVFSLEPIFAGLFGYYFVNEIMTLKELFGAALIICGIIYYKMKSTEG